MTNKDWDEIYDLFEKVSDKVGAIKESGLISCKYMMGFVAVIFVLSLIVAVYSWFTTGSFPNELVRYVGLLFGVCYGSYCYKTCCEYKADREYEGILSKYDKHRLH